MQEIIRISTADFGHADADAEADRFGQAHADAEANTDLDTDEIVKKPGTRGKTWCKVEDMMLAESWMFVSLDERKCSQQTCDAYWKRIKDDFFERKAFQEHDTLPERNAKGFENRWAILQGLCNKFHGCRDQVWMRNESGKTDDLKVKAFQIVAELLLLFSCLL